MPTVRITRRLTANLRGYDLHPVVFTPGETYEVPEHLARWLDRNPEYGVVVGHPPAPPPAAPSEAPGDNSSTSPGASADIDALAALDHRELTERIAELENPATLAALAAAEAERPRPRKSVERAIEARLAALDGADEADEREEG